MLFLELRVNLKCNLRHSYFKKQNNSNIFSTKHYICRIIYKEYTNRMDKLTQNNIIKASRQKDETAFRTLVEHYQGMVYSFAFRLLCDDKEAEDITQDTFVRVWLHLSDYDETKKFTTWLYAITTNLCLDRIKYRKRFFKKEFSKTELDQLCNPDDIERELINSEQAVLISLLTKELSTKQRIVFTLRYLEELSVDEIVRITNMTPAKIKSNLFLARKAIREKMKEYEK